MNWYIIWLHSTSGSKVNGWLNSSNCVHLNVIFNHIFAWNSKSLLPNFMSGLWYTVTNMCSYQCKLNSTCFIWWRPWSTMAIIAVHTLRINCKIKIIWCHILSSANLPAHWYLHEMSMLCPSAWFCPGRIPWSWNFWSVKIKWHKQMNLLKD